MVHLLTFPFAEQRSREKHFVGEHGILTLELGFELLDRLVLGVFDDLGLAAVVEGRVTVLEELLEPAVELIEVEIVLIAQVRDGNLVDVSEPLEDGDFLGAFKMPTLLAPKKPPVGLN